MIMKRKFEVIIIIVGIVIAIIAISNMMQEPKQTVQTEYYTTNLFGAKMNLPDEINYVNKILDPLILDCYAVAWYNPDETGQAIVYMESFEEIQQSMPTNQTGFKFLENSLVRKYLEVNCLHLNSLDDLPENYDELFGVNPMTACLEYNSEDWCKISTGRTLELKQIEIFVEESEATKKTQSEDEWLTVVPMPEK